MLKILLKIENLWVERDGRKILKGVNLEVRKGEVHAVLGPNASGKSTLAKVILGYPKYKIIGGKIIFNGKDITKFPPEKRVKLGLAMAWQAPPAIRGVKLSQLLEKISKKSKKQLVMKEGKELLEREVNLNFSGGERKISEMMQLLAQKPRVAVFDEIDSGLDMRRLDVVSKIIKKEFTGKETAVLVITHSGQILNFLKPGQINVMVDGRMICESADLKKVLSTIKKYGYEKCKRCR